MQYLLRRLSSLGLLILLMIMVGCSEASTPSVGGLPSNPSAITLDVYKSPSCGCCTKWVEHIQDDGFSANLHHPVEMSAIKNIHSIAPQYQSCHTAISSQGYVFEGHIPARFITQFLANPPSDALGLSVPAMPVGSPGMEMGGRFMPYQVLLLKENGGAEVYATVERAEQQYTKDVQP